MTDATVLPEPTPLPPGPPPADVHKLKRQATYAAVGVAGFLIVIKLLAYAWTGSVSLLASLIDSGLDLLASGLNLLAVRHALEPADKEHRFGHGKAEAIAGLGQAAFIGGSGFFLVFESITRMIRPEPVSYGWVGIAVMLISLAATIALVTFQRRVLEQTRSVAIAADSFHYVTDIASNLSVLAALILVVWGGYAFADPLVGLGIALFILWGAYKIFRGAYDELMDREMSDAERDQIKGIAAAVPGVLSIHDLRTRRSGQNTFIQLHLDLPPDMTLRQAHVISDAVEMRIAQAFPGAEVLIHQDPEGVQEPRLDARIEP
jgi:ferrous-iron efflux pump FieF